MSKTYERLNELLLSGLCLQKALEELIDAYGSDGNIHAKNYCTKKIEPLYDQWRLTTLFFLGEEFGSASHFYDSFDRYSSGFGSYYDLYQSVKGGVAALAAIRSHLMYLGDGVDPS